LLFLKVWI